MFIHYNMPQLYHKPKFMTREERTNRPIKRYQCRSKKKFPKKKKKQLFLIYNSDRKNRKYIAPKNSKGNSLKLALFSLMGPFPMLGRFRKKSVGTGKKIENQRHRTFQRKQLLVRQAKQEKENKSNGEHLTLIERFNMLELTDDLKRLCPSVNREYSTYQPMTDVIYTKWERTRSLSVAELQPNLPLLDVNGNQSKSKVGFRAASSAEIEKMPVSTDYSISPLLLRKDIAAIVTDNIPPADRDSTPTKTAGKLSASTIRTSSIHKDSSSRRKQPIKKDTNIGKVRNWNISTSRHLLHPALMVEEESQSPMSFDSRHRVSTSGIYTNNKKKAWSRNETDRKNRKSAKELLTRKVNFSIVRPTFGQDSKNESVSKSIFWNIIPDDIEPLEFSLKEIIDIHGNHIPRIHLWHSL